MRWEQKVFPNCKGQRGKRMANRDKEGESFMKVSRRDFLKLSATAAAIGGGWTYNTAAALAYEDDTTNYKVTNTTCPYCSASCG